MYKTDNSNILTMYLKEKCIIDTQPVHGVFLYTFEAMQRFRNEILGGGVDHIWEVQLSFITKIPQSIGPNQAVFPAL